MAGERPRTASVAVVVLVVVARGVFRGVRGRGEEAASRGGGPRGGALRTRARVPRGDDDRRECRVGDARGSGGAATPSVRVVPVPVPVVEGVGAGVTIRHLLGSGGASVLGSGSRGCHGGDVRFVVLRAVEVDHSATPRHGFDVRGRDSPAARVGTYDVRATGEISGAPGHLSSRARTRSTAWRELRMRHRFLRRRRWRTYGGTRGVLSQPGDGRRQTESPNAEFDEMC